MTMKLSLARLLLGIPKETKEIVKFIDDKRETIKFFILLILYLAIPIILLVPTILEHNLISVIQEGNFQFIAINLIILAFIWFLSIEFDKLEIDEKKKKDFKMALSAYIILIFISLLIIEFSVLKSIVNIYLIIFLTLLSLYISFDISYQVYSLFNTTIDIGLQHNNPNLPAPKKNVKEVYNDK